MFKVNNKNTITTRVHNYIVIIYLILSLLLNSLYWSLPHCTCFGCLHISSSDLIIISLNYYFHHKINNLRLELRIYSSSKPLCHQSEPLHVPLLLSLVYEKRILFSIFPKNGTTNYQASSGEFFSTL